DHAGEGLGLLVAPVVLDDLVAAPQVSALERAELERAGTAVEIADEDAAAEAAVAAHQAFARSAEVRDQLHPLVDVADGEVADPDNVRVPPPVFGRGPERIAPHQAHAIKNAFLREPLLCASERLFVEIHAHRP